MSRVTFSHALSLAAVLALAPAAALAQESGPDQVEGRNAFLQRAVKPVAIESSRFVADVMTARGKHLGFGVVVDGFVLTSNGILAGDPLAVRVGGFEYPATVAGRDARNEVALLKPEWANGPHPGITLGSSRDLTIGDVVFVAGTLDGPVLAAGVVSAKDRRVEPSEQQGNILFGLFSDGNTGHKRAYPNVVHHDAPLQPEHFGAPLVDLQGRLLGINVANPYRGSSHAVAVDAIAALLPGLKSGAHASAPEAPKPEPRRSTGARAWLGVSAAPAAAERLATPPKPEPRRSAGPRAWLGVSAAPAAAERLALDYRYGIEVRGTEGPATKAGLEVGDVIVALDGTPFPDIDTFAARLGARAPGDVVRLTILRGKAGLVRDVEVTLGKRPE